MVLGVRCNAAENKPFIECDRVEPVRAVPELAEIQFEPSEDRVDGMLQATGDRLQGMFAKLVGISAAEEIHEMRFEDSLGEAGRMRVSVTRCGRSPTVRGSLFEELRTHPKFPSSHFAR